MAGIEGISGVGETLGASILRPDPEVVTVAHFALSGAPAAFSSVWLEIPLHCLDPDPPDGALSIHLFAGDGEASVDEFDVGELLGTYGCDPGELPVLRVVLTDEVQAYLDAVHPFLSVRLRTAVGTERYDLGSAGGIDDPRLSFFE